MATHAFLARLRDRSGQSMIEMALMLPLLLVLIGGIVDFGIATFIGQVAQFAARDGARLAATRPPTSFTTTTRLFPATELGSCTYPCAGSASPVLAAASSRIPDLGLFSGYTITAAQSVISGQTAVTVTISGTYNWMVLGLLNASLPLFGGLSFPDNVTIARSTSARWEWQ